MSLWYFFYKTSGSERVVISFCDILFFQNYFNVRSQELFSVSIGVRNGSRLLCGFCPLKLACLLRFCFF